MKDTLKRLIQFEELSQQEAKELLINLTKSNYSEAELASFLTVYMMRKISLKELKGFKEALLELCKPVQLSEFDPIDLCGTGGDGKNTFNISTLAAFVSAGAGVKVAKHGNYGVSSVSGSSNVLEHLGIKFSSDEDFQKKCIDKTGICILHAPLFHPAMKYVGPVRKKLQLKTFFNMLGPMVNPSFPKKQVVGVFSLELLRMYAYIFQQEDKKFSILHDLNGYDEISLTGKIKIFNSNKEEILEPANFGSQWLQPNQLFGGKTVDEAAQIFWKILSTEGTDAQNKVVIANASLAISLAKDITYKEALIQAEESLLGKNALKAFNELKSMN